MGRPGAGSGGARRSGGHSSARSGGGHRVGGGSRPGGGSYRSGRSGSTFGSGSFRGGGYGGMGGLGRMPGGMGGFRGPIVPPMRPRRRRHGSSGILTVIVLILIVLFLFRFIDRSMTQGVTNAVTVTESTKNREKLSDSVPFDRNCVIDELGYTSNPSALGKDLEYFYEKTGVQPFIVLKSYDPGIAGNEDEYAEEWYEENIDNECTFLYMYFEDENPDEPGYMYYVNGKRVDSIMDSEAIEIFWGYMDRYWYSSMETDEMFETVFCKTADSIMTRHRTTQDVLSFAVVGIVILLVIYGIYRIIRLRAQRKKEEAEETERILNADIHKMSDDIADKVAEKYEDQEK